MVERHPGNYPGPAAPISNHKQTDPTPVQYVCSTCAFYSQNRNEEEVDVGDAIELLEEVPRDER